MRLVHRFWGRPLRSLGCCVAVALAGCTSANLEDCPAGSVLGDNTPGSARLRTSHYRVRLQYPDAAAARFLPYALMSAYAYRAGASCAAQGKVTADRARELEDFLQGTTGSPAWQLAAELKGGCEDEYGLMFHVWERREGSQTFVVVAFRGTSGADDWVFANAWPIMQAVARKNQYTSASEKVTAIIEHYQLAARSKGEPPPRFVTTGHSLGGGLAQHVLYTHPSVVEQAIVFDPSSITAFTSAGDENQRQGCACGYERFPGLAPEARMIRVYQTYEILTGLRMFHKIAFPPERHVQEVRFPFKSSNWNPFARHSMQEFASHLQGVGGSSPENTATRKWYESADASCTAKLQRAQAESCLISNAAGRETCPQ